MKIEQKIEEEIKLAGDASDEETAKDPVFLGYVKLGGRKKLDGVKLVSQKDALRIYFQDPWAGHVAYRHEKHENGFTSTAYGIGSRHPKLWLQVWGDKPDWELDLPQERPQE